MRLLKGIADPLVLVPKWHLACGGQIRVLRTQFTESGYVAKCSNILQVIVNNNSSQMVKVLDIYGSVITSL